MVLTVFLGCFFFFFFLGGGGGGVVCVFFGVPRQTRYLFLWGGIQSRYWGRAYMYVSRNNQRTPPGIKPHVEPVSQYIVSESILNE